MKATAVVWLDGRLSALPVVYTLPQPLGVIMDLPCVCIAPTPRQDREAWEALHKLEQTAARARAKWEGRR